MGGKRLRFFAAGVLALSLVAAACSNDDDGGGGAAGGGGGNCSSTDQVTLQLQWFIQAQFAGYFAAQDQGFYADQCLDVTIVEGGVDIVPQQQLADGAADFAIAWVPKALATREAGANIVDIAQVFQRSGRCRSRSRTRGSRRRPISPARRSATGGSATSTRSSRRSRRRTSTRRPT
jgi:NitT/TauT family transport system substrate-binding protein